MGKDTILPLVKRQKTLAKKIKNQFEILTNFWLLLNGLFLLLLSVINK